jgi:hypothetical protein
MSKTDFIIATARWERAIFMAMRPKPERELAVLLLRWFTSQKDFNADGSLRCWPSLETLAACSNKHLVNVQRNLTRLINDLGVLSKEPRGRHLVYTFRPEWLADAEKNLGKRRAAWPNHGLDGPSEPQKGRSMMPIERMQRQHDERQRQHDERRRVVNGTGSNWSRQVVNALDAKPRETSAAKEYCNTNRTLITLGDVESPGAVLMSQFKKARKAGFADTVILKARDRLISQAQRSGYRAYLTDNDLQKACKEVQNAGRAERHKAEVYDDD